MGIFITYRCIKETRSQLFRRRETLLYPSFNFYPGASSDPWWEQHEALFFFRFRFRRAHFLQLMDAMDLTGKTMKCSGARLVVHKTAGETPMSIIILQIYASWLFCVAYLIHAHLRSWSIFLGFHPTEIQNQKFRYVSYCY
jgi:hypothetical protein